MKEINELTKLTLKSLSEKNLDATPENYEKEFFSLAKKKNFVNDEINELQAVLTNLSKNDKKSLNSITYKEISKILSKRVKDEDLKHFLKHLAYFMIPSLSLDIKTDINNVCTDISKSPNSLIDIDTIRRLRRVTTTRVNDDKRIFNEKNDDVKKLISFLSEFLKKRVDENRITVDEISNIREEIKSLELSESSDKQVNKLYKKLTKLVDRFTLVVDKNSENIVNSQDMSDKLYAQIEKLKHNLTKAEEEKSIDFLTKVLTRRAYSLEVEKIEKEYKAFGSNYAIVFLDIDHFKEVNDTYGHICGDSVLSTFGSILKKLTRNEDIISRYGGEEFVCLIHYNNIFDIRNYVNRVKNIVGNNKFVFNDIKLNINFSAGVALREKYSSYENMIKEADILLYEAKSTGRGKIIFDNGEIL